MRHIALSILLAAAAAAQDPAFEKAAAGVDAQLRQAVAELTELQERIAAEKVPLVRELNDLERELSGVRQQYQQATRLLDTRQLDLNNLRDEIESRSEESAYLSTLLGEYVRTFESRLHIAELQRYEDPLQAVKLAMENANLSKEEVYAAQTAVVTASLDRLDQLVNGVRFEGTAIAPDGLQQHGTYVLTGPAALFRSQDGRTIGTAEQRLGSLEPAVVAFQEPELAQAAARLVQSGEGSFPLDPTLGNAHKIEATQETLWEHVQAGGPVMVPILLLAAAAFALALYKWLRMAFLRRPSKKQVAVVLDAVGKGQCALAKERAKALRGPVGEMLRVGVEHVEEPSEMIEEVMFENLLTTKLRLNGLLPFIAISAAAAPLLGLLGTVTGIINTFKQITVYGSGDVKMLSGGISEALITTEFGLIVAIPSLLIHAFLSRKARGIVGEMETAGIALINRIAKTPDALRPGRFAPATAVVASPDPGLVRVQVHEIVREMLGPLAKDGVDNGFSPSSS